MRVDAGQGTGIGVKQIRLILGLAATALAATVLVGCATAARPAVSQFPSPVAYVTAQTPPQVQPTATLLALASATPAPAPPVAKRLPIDTSAAVGLWLNSPGAGSVISRVADIAVGEVASATRKANPTLVTLGARQVYFGYSGTITAVRSAKPNLFLYDAKQAVALASTNKEPLLNIRDPEVRALLADDSLGIVRSGGLDGIVLEGLGTDLIRVDAGPVYTGTKLFTDQQRKDAVEGLLRAVRARIPDKLIVAGGYAWTDGDAFGKKATEALELASIVDGVKVDEFLRAPAGKVTSFKKEEDWKKDIDLLGSASSDGRIVLLSTRIVITDVTAELARQWLQYTVVSYLVGKNGNHSYLQFEATAFPNLADDPYLTAPIGSPLEAYSKSSSGIYKRQFSNGLVLINVATETKKFDVDKLYKTISGATVDKTVSMGANSAIILLNQ